MSAGNSVKVVQGFKSVWSRRETRDYEESPDLGVLSQQALRELAEWFTGLTSPGEVKPEEHSWGHTKGC